MEKQGYREILETLRERFPGKVTITIQEAAEALGIDVRAIYSAMNRVRNPLPVKRITKRRIVIPIASLARYLA